MVGDGESAPDGQGSIETTRNEEQLSSASLTVHIDRQKLRDIDVGGRTLTENLQELQETFLKLPETLQFQPGITLVVGENGSGKSTLARAIYFKMKEGEYLRTLKAKQDELRAFDADDPFIKSQLQTDEELSQSAYHLTYEPGGTYDHLLEIKFAGFAPKVAHAIDLEARYTASSGSFGDMPRLEYDNFPVILASEEDVEGSSIYGLGSDQDRDVDRDLTVKGKRRGSHRQTAERVIFNRLKEQRDKNPNAKKVHFFDEPETGLSPRRHQHLVEDLRGLIDEGSIAIVPTNSIVLYQSDLPRIDLDFPERGIHKPSDFPQV